MKRFAPLALIVLALAVVPAALADDGTPAPAPPAATTAQAPARQNAGRPGTQLRVEILRLRMQIVQLRFRLHCGQNGNASHERCVAFAQKLVDRLTKLDGKVQAKLTELKACTPDSTDPKCKNADKKIAVLTRVDTHLQNVIQKLQDWLDGKSSGDTSPASSDSALDQAASSLGQAATGSNG
jgi:ArsR family metal-binding transcriptional regulator